MLAPPYQKTKPHPFLFANRLVAGSYISLQAALAYHSLIPEHVAVITSVSPKRPGEWDTPLGRFTFRHIHSNLFFGYESVFVSRTQRAFVATPAKALLDLVHLQPQGDSPNYLASLRLQNLDRLDVSQLRQLVSRSGKPKLRRAAEIIAKLAAVESAGYEPL